MLHISANRHHIFPPKTQISGGFLCPPYLIQPFPQPQVQVPSHEGMVSRRTVDAHPPAHCFHPQHKRGGRLTHSGVHPEELFFNLVSGQTKLFLNLLDKRLPGGKWPANLLPPAATQDIGPQLFQVFLFELPFKRGERGVEGAERASH
jgi:hypothetical protein